VCQPAPGAFPSGLRFLPIAQVAIKKTTPTPMIMRIKRIIVFDDAVGFLNQE
jgi:hypothetical protein